MRRLRIFMILSLLLTLLPFPVHAKSQFEDIDESYWYAPYVEQANSMGIMTGTTPSQFSPYSQMSRAMAAVVYYRLAGSPTYSYRPIFPDVPSGTYFSEAVTWAYDNGVIHGYENGTFGPADPLTREQMILMAYRDRAGKGGVSWGQVDLSAYNDAGNIGHYAYQAMIWSLYYNIATSVQGNLHPEQPITRAESCRILMLTSSLQKGQDPSTIEKIPSDPYHCPHINTQVLTLSEASCQHDGLQEVKCIDCQRELEQIAIQSSEHLLEWHTVVEPTEWSAGLKVYQCRDCGYTDRQEIIPAGTTSQPSEDEVTTPPVTNPSVPSLPSDSGETQTIMVDTGYGYEPVTGYYNSDIAREIFESTNYWRMQSGLPAYQWGDLLNDKVRVRASELPVYVSHMRPNGQHALQYFLEDSRIKHTSENIAYGMHGGSADEAMSTWLASDSHAAAIFSTKFDHMAVGVFTSVQNGHSETYYVQAFYTLNQ